MDPEELSVKGANHVSYHVLGDPSLVKERTMKSHPALHNTIHTDDSGNFLQPLRVKFNLTEGEFVSAETSVLRFDVRFREPYQRDSTERILWNTSALDLIDTVTLTDKYGNVLEHRENVAGYSACTVGATHDDAYLNNGPGRLCGFNQNETGYNESKVETDSLFVTSTEADPRSVYLPLKFLCGLFAGKNLLPPHLMGEAHLEVRFVNLNKATRRSFVDVLFGDQIADLGAGPVYSLGACKGSITNLELMLDTVLLQDALQSKLHDDFMRNGLAIKYTTDTFVARRIGNEATTLHMPIKQSFTRANRIYMRVHAEASEPWQQNITDTHYHRPAFLAKWVSGSARIRTLAWPFKRVQARIGHVSFPDQPIRDSNMARFLWDVSHGLHQGGEASSEFNSEFQARACVCIDLNRSVAGHKNASGQTISTKFASNLAVTLNAADEIFQQQDFSGANATAAHATIQETRNVETWIEHERLLVVKAGGNTVFV